MKNRDAKHRDAKHRDAKHRVSTMRLCVSLLLNYNNTENPLNMKIPHDNFVKLSLCFFLSLLSAPLSAATVEP
ncbi:MAG: hypothetical protein VSS75_027190, partial [Candidatus Parabeggiatoa sp.]|nr:hypothetical protein [Candidatus Parabeggiatoa sp.]